MADINFTTLHNGANPGSFSFAYQKYSGVIPSGVTILKAQISDNYGLFGPSQVLSKPGWLTIILQGVFTENGVKVIQYQFSINEQYANQLGVGYHNFEVKIQAKTTYVLGLVNTVFNIPVTVQVSEYQPLSIYPTSFHEVYTSGAPSPAGKIMSIEAEGSWSATTNQPWLNLSQQQGEGNGNVTLFADPSGLVSGSYSADIIVQDVNSSKIAKYVLLISENSGAEEYITATPDVIQFSENYQQPPVSHNQIVIDSSSPVTLSTDVNWLNLSAMAFQEGTHMLNVSSKNTEVLSIGMHTGAIKVISNSDIFEINVVLIIIKNSVTGIFNNSFYFAESRRRLNITNANSNQECLLKFKVEATEGQEKFTKKIPYFKNTLSEVIGLETNILLLPNQIPNQFFTGSFNALEPIKWQIDIFDKEIGDNVLKERASFTNLKFINGRDPKEALKYLFSEEDIYRQNRFESTPAQSLPTALIRLSNKDYRLTYLPKKIAVPKDGVIALSFYMDFDIMTSVTANSLHISGAVSQNVTDNPYKNLNCYFIKLSNYDLSPGDKLMINAGIISCVVQIKPSELPTVKIIWRNEWGYPEVFNCTGEVQIEAKDKKEIVTLSREGNDYEKIIQVKRPKEYLINTGNIYYKAEKYFLSEILRSQQVWIEIDGMREEVIPKFRNLKSFKSRINENNFELKFQSAEQ